MNPLIESLRRAVEAAPEDVPLRLHLAGLLLDEGDAAAAIAECGQALVTDPNSAEARALMGRALGGTASPSRTSPAPGGSASSPSQATSDRPGPGETTSPEQPAPQHPAAKQPTQPPRPTPPASSRPEQPGSQHKDFDWGAAEEEVSDLVEPMFVGDRPPELGADSLDVERPSFGLDQVAGMSSVKDRINASFLAPLRNPEMRRLYGKSLKGGLLMYGPPGCGKTYIARALAGELGTGFLSISISDVLGPYIGQSEDAVHQLFQFARQNAPMVVFLDEVDTLGGRRSQSHGSAAMRSTINQLLVELDGVDSLNDSIFVLGATNQPWDIDPALRRPGRLDRTILVLPPDEEARAGIFTLHLRSRPVEAIDVRALARRSEGFSSADIAYACDMAAERALMDSVASGSTRMIAMADLNAALKQVQPSMTSWFASARNMLEYGAEDGTHADLRSYMKSHHLM
ncbi:MAG: AAA family ATPase [Acidipropionibacterium sp.]|nr:AAA family ATPase [Acidipropionibacterium sp.]MCI1749585.1 AAA family ATPase [Acidipropionibacterium sp.]